MTSRLAVVGGTAMRTKKDGVERWRCTMKTCKAHIETLNSDVVSDVDYIPVVYGLLIDKYMRRMSNY